MAAPAERVDAIQQFADAMQVALTEPRSTQQIIEMTEAALQQHALQQHADAMAVTQAQALPRTSAAGSDGPSFGQQQAKAIEDSLAAEALRVSAIEKNVKNLEASNADTGANTAAAEERKGFLGIPGFGMVEQDTGGLATSSATNVDAVSFADSSVFASCVSKSLAGNSFAPAAGGGLTTADEEHCPGTRSTAA